MQLFKVNLDKVLRAEKAEAELKVYEFTNSIHHSQALLGYYNTRLKAINEQLDQRQKGQENPPPKSP